MGAQSAAQTGNPGTNELFARQRADLPSPFGTDAGSDRIAGDEVHLPWSRSPQPNEALRPKFDGEIEEPKEAWLRIKVRAGIANLRIHDLRRMLGSWQARTGASLVLIGKSLNHATPQAARKEERHLRSRPIAAKFRRWENKR